MILRDLERENRGPSDVIRIVSDVFPLGVMDGKYLTGDFPSRTHVCQVVGEQWKENRNQYRRFFSDAYKFAVCRNPLDRYVSGYNYVLKPKDIGLKKGLSILLGDTPKKKLGTHEFTHLRALHHFIPYEGDKLLVDKLIRFENLQDDFSEVCSHIGIPELNLPVTRKTSKDNKSYMEYYDDESEAMARKYFAKDFELFNYQ